MGEWLLAGVVVLVFAFVILRPDLWGKRGDGSSGGEGGFYAADGRRHDDSDGDGNGDGGGD